MSSRTTGKTAGRDRAAALRAAQAAAERRRRVLIASGAIALVVVVIVAFVIAKAAGIGTDDGSGPTNADSGIASPEVVDAVTSVPAATLDAVGPGGIQAAPTRIDAPPLTADGKPRVLYVGAEYCPFCAAQRWPLIVALSRFGTWSDLAASSSASDDVFPDTPTLSFHGATFTSDHLAFTGVETSTNERVDGQYEPLDELTPADQEIFETYNRPPYTAGSPGGIPFLNIAGEYAFAGASYSPEILAGKSLTQVAAALADPTDPIGQAVGGSANILTAALCETTGGAPTSVCSAPGVKAATIILGSSPSP